jgi:hypothetical protein
MPILPSSLPCQCQLVKFGTPLCLAQDAEQVNQPPIRVLAGFTCPCLCCWSLYWIGFGCLECREDKTSFFVSHMQPADRPWRRVSKSRRGGLAIWLCRHFSLQDITAMVWRHRMRLADTYKGCDIHLSACQLSTAPPRRPPTGFRNAPVPGRQKRTSEE